MEPVSSNSSHRLPSSETHQAMCEQLYVYAAAQALGHATQAAAEAVEHLAQCAICHADVQDLLELVASAYAGQPEPAAEYPLFDLSFLTPMATMIESKQHPWFVDQLGRLVVTFSDALLATMRQPSVAGATRGQLVYRYTQDPTSMHNLGVTVEVFAEDQDHRFGRVQILIDVASSDPFDQAGSQVVLRAGETTWAGETDEVGYVDFKAVPLAVLPQMRIEILPRGAHAHENCA